MKHKPSVEEILKEVQSFNDNDNLQAVARERAKPALDRAYAEIFLELVGEAKPMIIAHYAKTDLVVLNRKQAQDQLRAELRAAIKERLGGA